MYKRSKHKNGHYYLSSTLPCAPSASWAILAAWLGLCFCRILKNTLRTSPAWSSSHSTIWQSSPLSPSRQDFRHMGHLWSWPTTQISMHFRQQAWAQGSTCSGFLSKQITQRGSSEGVGVQGWGSKQSSSQIWESGRVIANMSFSSSAPCFQFFIYTFSQFWHPCPYSQTSSLSSMRVQLARCSSMTCTKPPTSRSPHLPPFLLTSLGFILSLTPRLPTLAQSSSLSLMMSRSFYYALAGTGVAVVLSIELLPVSDVRVLLNLLPIDCVILQESSFSSECVILAYIRLLIRSISTADNQQLHRSQVSTTSTMELNHLLMLQKPTGEIAHHSPKELLQVNPRMVLMCGYLYLMQGVMLSLPITMTLMYSELPPYYVLSVFAASWAPFSFKFLLAPLVEKVTNIKYGKRKTWLIASQALASSLIFLGSFLTSDEHQLALAFTFFFALLCVSLNDISLDALAIKEIKSAYVVAMTQSIMQTAGLIVGSLVFLKASSMEFAESIGLQDRIAQPSTSLRVICVLLLVPTLMIHFLYKQTILASERRAHKKSLLQIVKNYRIFFRFDTRYCRNFLMFLLFQQGFNSFAGYEYELARAGFKRNTINTIGNLVLIPIAGLALYLGPRVEKIGWAKIVTILLSARWLLCSFAVLTFPSDPTAQSAFTSVPVVSFFLFFSHLFDTGMFMLASYLVNSYEVMGLSGMFMTMLNSGYNMGTLKSPHLAMIGVLGWKTYSLIGFIYEAGVIMALPCIVGKVLGADLGLSAELFEEQSETNIQNADANELQDIQKVQQSNNPTEKNENVFV